jgi:hypothetical protein
MSIARAVIITVLSHSFLLDTPDRLFAQPAIRSDEPLRAIRASLQLIVEPGHGNLAEPAATPSCD